MLNETSFKPVARSHQTAEPSPLAVNNWLPSAEKTTELTDRACQTRVRRLPPNGSELLFFAKVAAATIRLVAGSAAACGIVPDYVGITVWIVSTASLLRLLSARRRPDDTSNRAKPYSITTRVLIASIAVFCIAILIIAGTAGALDPNAMEDWEEMVFLAITVVGAIATGVSIILTRR